MRFVVTGGTGHIGNNVVRALRATYPDAEIRVLTRRPVGHALADVAYTEVVGDLFDVAFLAREILAGDYLVHTVGYIDMSGRHADETFRVNVELTRLVTDVAVAAGVSGYVFFGSVDGIDKQRASRRDAKDDTPISEPDAFDATPISGNYGKSKAMAMQYVQDVMRAHPDVPICMLLPSAVLGVHDYKPSPIGKILLSVLADKPEFGIPGGYNFVDVRDVAAATVAALARGVRGTYILAGANVSVSELYATANRVLGKTKKPILLPTWMAWLAMPFVKALNPVTLRALSEPHAYTSAAASRALGFTARPFDETMQDTLAWFAAQKKL